MSAIISPDLLQLLAIAVADDGDEPGDRHLRPGRHLRWMPSPMLGFPRRGFVVRRRPSPSWPWTKRGDLAEARTTAGTPDGGALWVAADGLDDRIAGRRGVRVSRPGETLSASARLPVGDTGLMIEFQDRTPLTRPDPAAWVALHLTGRDVSRIVATTWSSSGTGDDRVLSEVAATLGDLAPWSSMDPSEGRVLLLPGGLVDAVELHADGDTQLVGLSWLVTQLYVDDGSSNSSQTGWEDVGRFLLPISGDGVTYPTQSSPAGIATDRLAAAAPRAAAPWDDPTWPPAPLSRSDAEAMLARRHLGTSFERTTEFLEQLLREEREQFVPQGQVRLRHTLTADGASDGDEAGDSVDLDLGLLGLLLTASLDAPVAHMLGLATVDLTAPDQVPYDYAVTAAYPAVWVASLTMPGIEKVIGDHLGLFGSRTPIVPPLPPAPLGAGFARVASVATMVLPAPQGPLPAPRDVTVELQQAPGRHPHSATALVRWHVDEPGIDRRDIVVGSTLGRVDTDGHVSLARRDPITGIPLARIDGPGPQEAVDDQLRTTGAATWSVRSVDLWGRWSPPASAAVDVEDFTLPPPPPSGLTASLGGPVEAGSATTITVSFDSEATHEPAAEEVERFELGFIAGEADIEEATPTLSAEVRLSGGANEPVRSVRSVARDDGGQHITVVLGHPPVQSNGHRHTTTVMARAVGDGGPSRWVSTVVDLLDEATPEPIPGLPGIQRTSWPDAQGMGWWTSRWTSAPGVHVQVLRASAAQLLAAAGEERAAFDRLPLEEQAERLRQLAAAVHAGGASLPPGVATGDPIHAAAFVPDHPHALTHPVDHHAIAIDSATRDLTVVVHALTGPTGTRAPWPTDPAAFTVVAAQPVGGLAPVPIRVQRHQKRVAITVDLAGVDAPRRVWVWRTADPRHAADIRRMRPLPPVVVDAAGTVEVFDTPGEQHRWVAYRAAVDVADGRRSAPSLPVWVHFPTAEPRGNG